MLLVDKRERTLAEVLRQADVEFVLQTLPVGDVMWQETGRCWIAERKRADDLAASIKSGRCLAAIIRPSKNNYFFQKSSFKIVSCELNIQNLRF